MASHFTYDEITSVRLPVGTLELAKKIANHVGIKPSEIYRRAVLEALKPLREEMERDLAQGAEHHTRRHAPGPGARR